MLPRRLVAIVIAVTVLSLSASASATWQRATVGAERCCARDCPWDRPGHESPESCCEEAPVVTVVTRRPAFRVPILTTRAIAPHAAPRPVTAFERTAYGGDLDRTLLGQRTSLLH